MNKTIIEQIPDILQPLHCFQWRRVFLHVATSTGLLIASRPQVMLLRSRYRWLVSHMPKASSDITIMSAVLDAVGARIPSSGRLVTKLHSTMTRLRCLECLYTNAFFRKDLARVYRPTAGCVCPYCVNFMLNNDSL